MGKQISYMYMTLIGVHSTMIMMYLMLTTCSVSEWVMSEHVYVYMIHVLHILNKKMLFFFCHFTITMHAPNYNLASPVMEGDALFFFSGGTWLFWIEISL